jgi:predicted nucleic acid-binding protein
LRAISPSGKNNAVKLAADANVLLSAVIGGRAKAILEHPSVEEVITTRGVLDEVEEYAPILAAKRRLALDLVLMAVAALPIRVVSRPQFQGKMAAARKRVGKRDPDDVELLALALHSKYVLWSNDKDFQDAGVEVVTTAQLLSRLFGTSATG